MDKAYLSSRYVKLSWARLPYEITVTIIIRMAMHTLKHEITIFFIYAHTSLIYLHNKYL